MSTILPIPTPDATQWCGIRMNLTQQPDLSHLPHIQSMYCSGNEIQVLYEELFPPNVRNVCFRGNQLLSDGLCTNFPNSIETLNLEMNRIEETDIVHSWPTALRELSLDDNRLSKIPSHLPESLELLSISYNELRSLKDLPRNLKKLRAYYNHITTIGPSGLPPGLIYAYLSYNSLKSATIFRQPLPSSLVFLNLSNNCLKWLPKTLPDSLQTLVVANNHLTELPETLPSQLRLLVVNDNRIRRVTLKRRIGQPLFALYIKNNCIVESLQHYRGTIVETISDSRNWNMSYHDRCARRIQRAFKAYQIQRGVRQWSRVQKFHQELVEVAMHPDFVGRWDVPETWSQWNH
jgi:Leucine-rich repeat (LRR) protein